VKGSIKEAMLEGVRDSTFTAEIIQTLVAAALSASEKKELRVALLEVIKQGVTNALNDERFMEEMLKTGSSAVIFASRDKELKDALGSVTREAITDALKDQSFMTAFREAAYDSLKDGNIYKSAAAGVLSTMNPFKPK